MIPLPPPIVIKRWRIFASEKWKKNMYRLYSVLYNFSSTFRSPGTVKRPWLSKIILIDPTFRPHFVCELSIDIIYLQTFLRKKIYCFKFATIKKGMFRCENQIIVPQASFITNHQTCKSFHSRESKTFLDSAADSRFQVLDSSFCPWNLDSWFQSLVGFRIPKPRIPDFTSKIFLDSRFHKQIFPRFRNPEPLTVRNVNVSKTPR